MSKKKAARLAGFVGALCATGALVGAGVQATGAYFTDHTDGTLSANSGGLTISATSGTNLNFANLMPGSNVTKQVGYKVAASSGKVDVWLVFDADSHGYQAFTGGTGSTNAPDGGLGRYGYFKVSDSHGGQAFRSGNLAFSDHTNTPNSGASCATNTITGRGGSDWIATSANEGNATEYCGVPAAIELATGLNSGQSGTVSITFGLNGYMQTQQNQTEPTVGYHIVATQAGQAPNDSYQG